MITKPRPGWLLALLCVVASPAGAAAECDETQAFGIRFDQPLESAPPGTEIDKLYWQVGMPNLPNTGPGERTARVSYQTRQPFAVQQTRRFEKPGELFGSNGDDDAMTSALIAVTPEGTVLDVTVAKSSGVPILDDAAQVAVWNADPLPPLPDAMRKAGEDRYRIAMPVHFEFR